MRIRMLVQLSGPAMALEPGDERDFPADEAIRLIKAGYAVAVTDSRAEMAVLPPAPDTRRSTLDAAPHALSRRQRTRAGQS